jgi:dihydroorotase
MKDILNVMSKFLVMGMNLHDVIEATTWHPAQEIQRKGLGNLSVGAGADVAVLKLEKGNFGFFDYKGYTVKGNEKLGCEMTIRDGRIVYDLNAIATPVIAPRRRR